MFHSLTTCMLALMLTSRSFCLVPALSPAVHQADYHDSPSLIGFSPRSEIQPPRAFTGQAPRKRQADSADEMDDEPDSLKRSCSDDHDMAQDKREDEATFVGKLQVAYKNGTILGFVGRQGQSYFVVNDGSVMQFDASTSGLTRDVNIFDEAEMFKSSFPNFGAVIPRGTNLTTSGEDDSDNYAAIVAVMTTEPRSTPQPPQSGSDDSRCDAESAIWIFDADSTEVTAQWIGYAQEPQPTFIHFDSNEGTLLLRGSDCEACVHALPVIFTLV